MAHIVPSRRALRHLARLCSAETPFSAAQPVSLAARFSQRTQTNSQTTESGQTRSRRKFSTCRPLGERTPPPPPPQTSTSPISSEQQPDPSTSTSTSTSTIPDITTYYSLFPNTLPKGPPPSGAFSIGLPQLRKEFLQLQSQHHPDKYSASPQSHKKALALSALINAAYKTLSDPLLRAQYLLLNRHGIDVMSEDNSSHPTDQSTLMEVMEAQEGIEAAEGEDQIEALKEENSTRIQETEMKMGVALESDDAETAKNECVRLKYWRSLQDGLNDWEPRKEVRLIH